MPLSIFGRTINALRPRTSRTKISSRSEKARSVFPTRDVTIVSFTAGCAVGAVRQDVVGAMLSWAFVEVRLTPWVHREFFFQVGAIPPIDCARLLTQRLKAF